MTIAVTTTMITMITMITTLGECEECRKSLEERCHDIEQMVTKIAADCQKVDEAVSQERRAMSGALREALQRRRELRKPSKLSDSQKQEFVEVNKLIQKEIKKTMKVTCKEKIKTILSDFSGVKHIANIRSN